MNIKKVISNRGVSALVIALLFALCMNHAAIASETTVVSKPEVLPLDKKGKVTLTGSGFKDGQKVRIVVITIDGLSSDITHYCKPAPASNNMGEWSTVFSYGRLVKKKLVKEGKYKLKITDELYNTLSVGELTFK